jgi:hypothetical protein
MKPEPPDEEPGVLAANLRPPGPRFDPVTGEPVRDAELPDQRGKQRVVYHLFCGPHCSHE